MQTDRSKFQAKYGPWGVIIGGSDGIGAEFARQVASQGLNLVLVGKQNPGRRKKANEGLSLQSNRL
jgi:short-subunit dehydrogenase